MMTNSRTGSGPRLGAIAAVMLVYLLAGPVLQTIKGNAPFDWGLALRWLFGLLLPSALQYAALAVMAHALVNRKALGHVVVIGVYLLLLVRTQLGIEHRLFDFAGHPGFKYSEMNGFGDRALEISGSGSPTRPDSLKQYADLPAIVGCNKPRIDLVLGGRSGFGERGGHTGPGVPGGCCTGDVGQPDVGVPQPADSLTIYAPE